jgi:hypothetical protein
MDLSRTMTLANTIGGSCGYRHRHSSTYQTRVTKDRSNRMMGVAAGGLCGLGFLTAAAASPPFGHGNSSLSTIDSARSVSAVGRYVARQEKALTAQLDLHPPRDAPSDLPHHDADSLGSTPFPSSIHHLDLGRSEIDQEDRTRLPALHTSETTGRLMSPAETLVRRVHREGLPMARLWQSKSAVLSIGLNNRGRPGLWLTQKVH